MDTYSPQPGDYFLTAITGFAGGLIRTAQALTGDPSRYTHAGVVLDDGTVLETMPSGAKITPLSDILERDVLAFSMFDLTDEQRSAIVGEARKLVGVGYSFVDYLFIGLINLGIRTPQVLNRVSGENHLICSQLVDKAFNNANIYLFDDGRDEGDVTPGDLSHVGVIFHSNTGPWFTKD